MKDENGYVMVSSDAVSKKWKEYFEKLMNEENNRDPRTEEIEVVNEKVNCISREEVKNALRRMKKGKAGQKSKNSGQIPIRDKFFLSTNVPIHHFKNMVNLILSKSYFAQWYCPHRRVSVRSRSP